MTNIPTGPETYGRAEQTGGGKGQRGEVAAAIRVEVSKTRISDKGQIVGLNKGSKRKGNKKELRGGGAFKRLGDARINGGI